MNVRFDDRASRLSRVATGAAVLLILTAGCSAPSQATVGDPRPGASKAESEDEYPPAGPSYPQESAPEAPGIGHRLLFWIPNRVFDALDVVRARVRIGPGWTLSARATELADINMGAHKSVFVGLRGPRKEPAIPWPGGLEVFEGVEVSVMDASDAGDERGPRYGAMEVGVGIHVLAVGVDAGVAVLEVLDFAAGVFLLDPLGDDF